MQRHTMTEIVNHNRSTKALGTISKNTGVGVGVNRFYVATTLPGYIQDICSFRVKGF